MEKNSYVYILASRKNGTIYIGVTTHLIDRVFQHKNKCAPGFTTIYNVGKLVYYEQHFDIKDAISREKQLKLWRRKKKLALIEKTNPTWRDLYNEICSSA